MNHLTSEQQALLILLRQSLWGETTALPEEVNWQTVDAVAKQHAVIPLVYDGAVAMKAAVPSEILQKWKNTMLRGLMRNEKLLAAQDTLMAQFSQAGIPAAILKGSSVSRYYPQPELRILGDIDVLVGRQSVNLAKEIIETQGYELCESDHDFHIGYRKPGSYVELHYDVTKLPDSAGGSVTREVISHFLEDIQQETIDNHVFPVLSETHQAIMLLLHMIRHMFDVGIGLRQLCDWAVYISNADAVVFQEQTLPLLSRCGLLQYAKAATGACVQYLGLSAKNTSWCAAGEDELYQSFIADVFRSGNMGSANEAMGSLFTDSEAMGTGQTALQALVVGVNRLAYMHFPVMKKHKILLPLAWVYLPIRYFVRSMLGLRPPKSAKKVVSAAKKRRELYEMLRMFEIENSDAL